MLPETEEDVLNDDVEQNPKVVAVERTLTASMEEGVDGQAGFKNRNVMKRQVRLKNNRNMKVLFVYYFRRVGNLSQGSLL